MSAIPIGLCVLLIAIQSNAEPSLSQRVEACLAHGCSVDHLGPGFESALVNDLMADKDEASVLLLARIQQMGDYLTLSAREQSDHLAALRLYILCCDAGREFGLQQLKETIDRFSLAEKETARQEESVVTRRPASQPVYLLRSVILRAFGELRDKRIWALALKLIVQGDKAICSDTMRYYLEPILRSDAQARAILRTALDDQESDVFRNQTLLSLLENIENRDPDNTPKKDGH